MKILSALINTVRGACMAAADSIPGVSGATIAFILGFYDKFVNSVHDFLLGSLNEKKSSMKFLVPLGAGWVLSFLLCAVILSNLFDSHIYEISSFFIGLTIATLPIIIYENKNCLAGKYRNLIFTIIGIALVTLIVCIGSAVNIVPADFSVLTLQLTAVLFAAGIASICAMILPGISGSTILFILGVYVPLITAVSSLAHLNFSVLPILIIYGLGAIAGFFISIKVIRYCLNRFRSQTIYLSIGLVIGSIYAIIMGASTLKVPLPPLSASTFSIIFFIIGALIILGLQYLKIKIISRTEENQ